MDHLELGYLQIPNSKVFTREILMKISVHPTRMNESLKGTQG